MLYNLNNTNLKRPRYTYITGDLMNHLENDDLVYADDESFDKFKTNSQRNTYYKDTLTLNNNVYNVVVVNILKQEVSYVISIDDKQSLNRYGVVL